MPRFFVSDLSGDTAHVTGPDALHLAKVHRAKQGELFTLCDGKGTDYTCEAQSVASDCVMFRVISSCPSASEPTVAITLYQALPKGDKLDFICEKAVELGVTRIVPVLTHRCVSRPDGKSFENKRVRYNRICFEAAKQSGRGIIPEVSPLLMFEEAVKEMAEADLPLLFYEKSEQPLKTLLSRPFYTGAVMVGSEGGFEESEVEAARKAGIFSASLGPRILRCETAPLAVLSAILYETDNF